MNAETAKPILPKFQATSEELPDISPSNRRQLQDKPTKDPKTILQETFLKTRNVIQFSKGLNNLCKIDQLNDYYIDDNVVDVKYFPKSFFTSHQLELGPQKRIKDCLSFKESPENAPGYRGISLAAITEQLKLCVRIYINILKIFPLLPRLSRPR